MSRMYWMSTFVGLGLMVGLVGCASSTTPTETPPPDEAAEMDEGQMEAAAAAAAIEESEGAAEEEKHEGHEHGAEAKHEHKEAGEHKEGGEAKADDKVKANLAKLSPEDRASAEKQKTCPVSGELLGSMGVPKKVKVKDSQGKEHEVWICCSGCEKELKAKPDEYLKKVSQ